MALSAEIFLVVVQFRLKVLWSFFEGRFCSTKMCELNGHSRKYIGDQRDLFPTDISQKNHTLTGGYRWYRGGFLEHVNIARKLLVILPPQQNNALAKKRLKGIICLSNRSSMAKRCITSSCPDLGYIYRWQWKRHLGFRWCIFSVAGLLLLFW